MLKKIFKVGCVLLTVGIMSVPAWSSDFVDTSAGDTMISVQTSDSPYDGTVFHRGRGNGHGNGDGSGSGDGRGYDGVCPWGF